jgi:glutamate racemase
LIESGADDATLKKHIDAIMQQFSPECDGFILGCTHYPLIGDAIRNHLGDEITIINP